MSFLNETFYGGEEPVFMRSKYGPDPFYNQSGLSRPNMELHVPLCCTKCAVKVREALLQLDGVYGVLCDEINQRVSVSGTASPEKVLRRVRRIKKLSELVYQTGNFTKTNDSRNHSSSLSNPMNSYNRPRQSSTSASSYTDHKNLLGGQLPAASDRSHSRYDNMMTPAYNNTYRYQPSEHRPHSFTGPASYQSSYYDSQYSSPTINFQSNPSYIQENSYEQYGGDQYHAGYPIQTNQFQSSSPYSSYDSPPAFNMAPDRHSGRPRSSTPFLRSSSYTNEHEYQHPSENHYYPNRRSSSVPRDSHPGYVSRRPQAGSQQYEYPVYMRNPSSKIQYSVGDDAARFESFHRGSSYGNLVSYGNLDDYPYDRYSYSSKFYDS